MKTIVTILFALAVIIACASCESKSGKLAQERRQETAKRSASFSIARVQYDTLSFAMVNDTIALRKADHAVLVRKLDREGDFRFYVAD